MQILKAEQGYYTPGKAPGDAEMWHSVRILNGDETDRGVAFPDPEEGSARKDRGATVPDSPNRQRMAVRVTLSRF